MIVSIVELGQLLIASLVVGYIFLGIVKLPEKENKINFKIFDLKNYLFSVLASAPGIVLHELAHKFVAIAFGLKAFFTLWPFGLGIGILLKLLGSGFMFLAPGYVNISTGATNLQYSLIAFAGPLFNLLLWIIALLILKFRKNISRKEAIFWLFTKEINKWLFIFNMIPIPPLDGYKVFGKFFF